MLIHQLIAPEPINSVPTWCSKIEMVVSKPLWIHFPMKYVLTKGQMCSFEHLNQNSKVNNPIGLQNYLYNQINYVHSHENN